MVVCSTIDEAEEAINMMLVERALGDGDRTASIGARARAAVETSLTTADLAASLARAFADFAAR